MPSTAEQRASQYLSPTSPLSPRRRGSIAINPSIKMESVNQALKQRDGELLVCDVTLYYQLYQEHLQKSGGNQNLAKKYTFEAAKKDGIALMQENISALSVAGKPLFDLESRARMQLTPTANTYLLHQEEVFNETTGQIEVQKKMVSPEHAYIGRSVTEALTKWRRGNDAASMAQNERLFTSFDQKFDPTKTHTLVWASPIAKESEGELVHKYNGEYGYLYVGEITHEAGVRKMLVHSYKNDMSTESYQAFMSKLGGQEFFAGFGDQTTSQTQDADRLMRTSIMIEGQLTSEQIYKQMFAVKKQVEGVDTMFGIDEKTLLAVQDSELRQKLEQQASTEVAVWLAGEIVKGTDPKVVQSQIKDRYIQVTRKTINNVQVERSLKNSTNYQVSSDSVVSEDRVDLNALKAMKTNTGAFCGKWETGSGSGLAGSLKNLTSFSGGGWGGSEARSSNGETKHCDNCNQDRKKEEFGACGFCTSCFPE